MLHYFQVLTPAPTSTPWWITLILPLVPVVTGGLSKLAMDGLKQIIVKLDESSSIVKSIVAFVVSAGLGFLASHFTSMPALGLDIHGWSADSINAVLTWLVAAGIYRLNKNTLLATQGKATMEQRAALGTTRSEV